MDPLLEVHNTLWATLEANSGFTNLVPVGNRIKLTGDSRAPDKLGHQTSDYPQVCLVPQGGFVHLHMSSDGTDCKKRWEIRVATGDHRVDNALFELEWEILRSLSDTSSLTALLWDDAPDGDPTFVKDARPTRLTTEQRKRNDQQEIGGLATVWNYDVRMYFPTASLPPS